MSIRDVTYTGRNRSRRNRPPVKRNRRGTGNYRRHRRQESSSRAFWWFLAILLAVNIGVFWYHGNPWAGEPQSALVSMVTPDRSSAKSQILEKEAEPTNSAQGVSDTVSSIASRQGGSGNADGEVADSSDLGPLRIALPLRDTFDPTLGLVAAGPVKRVETITLNAGQAAAVALSLAGVPAADVSAAINSLKGLVDFRLMRPGHKFKLRFAADGALLSMDVLQGLLHQTRTERHGESWQGMALNIPVHSIETEVSTVVQSSLWEALVYQAHEDSRLVHALVEIFAWEIDFYSEVHTGDAVRILVDKHFAEGQFVGYGPVKAAEFVSAGVTHRAFWHKRPAPKNAPSNSEMLISYFTEDGASLRKQLLKAPLKYGHVTSTFGKRKHPVLGYTRSHNGTDYGVPTGTPVWSVGSGTVVRAGWHGGFGRLVEVRHANGWLSQYAHLSRLAVKPGQRVEQKQIVGNVGSSGLSTGPHLHYGLKKHGKYVNSLKQKFEPGKALVGEELRQFRAQVAVLRGRLQGMPLAQLSPRSEVK